MYMYGSMCSLLCQFINNYHVVTTDAVNNTNLFSEPMRKTHAARCTLSSIFGLVWSVFSSVFELTDSRGICVEMPTSYFPVLL